MTITTVAEFAKELKKSPDTLLEQLKSAGVAKGAGLAARRREARAIGRGITNERLPAHTRRL